MTWNDWTFLVNSMAKMYVSVVSFWKKCKGLVCIFFLWCSQLSMLVKMIPSPDWFVGVDSINLCQGNQWKQEVTVDLHPYDAGTDSGFTFSSPNFPSNPRENITKVSWCKAHIHPRLACIPSMMFHCRSCIHFILISSEVAGPRLLPKIALAHGSRTSHWSCRHLNDCFVACSDLSKSGPSYIIDRPSSSKHHVF